MRHASCPTQLSDSWILMASVYGQKRLLTLKDTPSLHLKGLMSNIYLYSHIPAIPKQCAQAPKNAMVDVKCLKATQQHAIIDRYCQY